MEKIKKNIYMTFFLALLSGCGIFNPCEDKELLRMVSPDGKVDAVMMRRNCGATTAYAYRIYIVAHGGTIPTGWFKEKFGLVFVADHLDGEIIEWIAPKILEIRYKKAQIFEFTNFWYLGKADNFNYVVEIREKKYESEK